MAHLTLQEFLDLIHRNRSYPLTRELRGARKRVERPHHPEYYGPRITRLFAGLLFGTVCAGGEDISGSNSPHSA